jgi:NAD(P)-dependent dehydrogenase (short-subunit alcohol dehydrogenase family)
MSNVVIIGGTTGIGRELAAHYAAAGRSVILTSRDAERAEKVAAELAGNGDVRGIALDLTRPHDIVAALADVDEVDHLALVAIERDQNTVKGYNIAKAIGLVTLKLVGYTTVVHALHDKFTPDGSVLLFGGIAKDIPYAGSTNVSAVNAGVIGMVRTMRVELAPVRVNSIHPGLVGDSPFWVGKEEAGHEATRQRTPSGKLVTMQNVVDASAMLLENPGLNGVDLVIDGGLS